MTGADIAGQQLASIFEDERPQHGALGQGKPLPLFLEGGLVLAKQPRQRRVEVLEPGRPSPRDPDIVPGFVGETLDVVGHVGGEFHDGGAEAGFGLEPGGGEARPR